MKQSRIVDILGWYGLIAILLAYILTSFQVIDIGSIWFPLLNGSGALGIIRASLLHKAYQPALLNIIWFVVAVIVLIRLIV